MDRLSLMQIFIEINELGSLAAVARARSQAPSAITQALQQLEEEVGVNLLVRTTRSMSLTPEGEHFLHDCRRIVADVSDAMEKLAAAGPLKGTIRLTTTNDFGRTRLPPLLDRFLALHPQVRLELVLSDEVVDLVNEHFDFAIRTGPLSDSRFKSRLLIHNRRVVCAAPQYWQTYGYPRHPSDLEEHNCLVLAREGNPQTTWYFQVDQTPISVRVTGNRSVNDGGVVRSWAIAGAGVAWKSLTDVEEDLAAGRLETALEAYELSGTNLYTVYPATHQVPRRTTALLDFLHEQPPVLLRYRHQQSHKVTPPVP